MDTFKEFENKSKYFNSLMFTFGIYNIMGFNIISQHLKAYFDPEHHESKHFWLDQIRVKFTEKILNVIEKSKEFISQNKYVLNYVPDDFGINLKPENQNRLVGLEPITEDQMLLVPFDQIPTNFKELAKLMADQVWCKNYENWMFITYSTLMEDLRNYRQIEAIILPQVWVNGIYITQKTASEIFQNCPEYRFPQFRHIIVRNKLFTRGHLGAMEYEINAPQIVKPPVYYIDEEEENSEKDEEINNLFK
jgi:hypothetical protein